MAESPGGPAWAWSPVPPPDPPRRPPPTSWASAGRGGGRGLGLGSRVPHAPEEGSELQQVQQQHERPVTAEVAVHKEECELHERAGQQREKQCQGLPHAVPAWAVSAAQVQRRHRLGQEQEHGRQHRAREFHLCVPAALLADGSSGGGLRGSQQAPALYTQSCPPGRGSWSQGQPTPRRWGGARGPAGSRPRAQPCTAQAMSAWVPECPRLRRQSQCGSRTRALQRPAQGFQGAKALLALRTAAGS